MRAIPLIALLALSSLLSVQAADPAPEIKRETGKPQAVGKVHTLRQIPEACARIEGRFTGQADKPYDFAVVKTSPTCAPRARFVDAAQAKPSAAGGWTFNDLIRVPSAACATQVATVRVWRKPASSAVPPKLDAQGKSRIYLKESTDKARQGALAAVPMYAAAMQVEGTPCP